MSQPWKALISLQYKKLLGCALHNRPNRDKDIKFDSSPPGTTIGAQMSGTLGGIGKDP